MISIITATYNAAAHLRHCLASIAAQGDCPGSSRDCPLPIEHIIIDGASTDGTVEIVEEYVRNVTRDLLPVTSHESRVTKFLSEKDHGLYDALNKGIRMATGDIIGLLHADDFYPAPDILAKVAAVFEDPAVEACYGDLLYVSEVASSEIASRKPDLPSRHLATSPEFKIVRYWQSGPFEPDKFKWGWMPPHPSFFVRRSVFEKYGLFNLDLGTAADYELMLRFLVKHRIRCAYLPEVLVCMRVGGASNRSLQARLQANRMDRKAWEVNGLHPYPWTIPLKPLRKISQWWKRPK